MAGAEGVDRLLRLLFRLSTKHLKVFSNRLHALPKKQYTVLFFLTSDPLGFDSVLKIKNSPSSRMSYFLLAGAEGVEPSLTVLETAVKPFNYAPIYCLEMVGQQGLEPRTDRL